MSDWTHNMCGICWRKRNPLKTVKPVTFEDDHPTVCCFCGRRNVDGIYVREDPRKPRCQGEHQ